MQNSQARRVQVGLLVVAYITFLVLVLNQSRTLFFVWEEWTQLLDAADTPLWGIFQSHFGYVAPLSRLTFGIEAKIFGDLYSGYVAVNAMLLLVFISLAWWKLPIRSQLGSWFLTAGLVTFLFSAGSFFATSFAAMNGYFMCWVLGISAIIAARSARWTLASLAMILSALSNNLMNVTVTFVVIATLFACMDSTETQGTLRRVRSKIVLLGSLSVALSAALFFLGRLFPAVDTSIGTSQSVALPESSEILDQLNQVLALVTVWIGSPFAPFVAINQSLYQRSVILLMDYHGLLVIGLLAFIGVLYFAARQGGKAPFLWLLLPIMAFAGQVVLFRGAQGFEARYTLMWFPAVVILWALWFDYVSGFKWLRVMILTLAGVVALTTVIAGPQFLSQSVDLVRPRTELSVALKDLVLQCGSVDKVNNSQALKELAPSMSWEEVCRAHEFVGRD